MKKLVLTLIICLLTSNAWSQKIGMGRRSVPSVAGGYTLPYVWSDNTNVKGLWYLEENTTSNRVNAQGTTNYNLVPSASTARSSSIFKQGTYSVDLTSTTYLSCTDANCGGTSAFDLTGNFSIGCWAYPTSSSNLRRILSKGASTTTASSSGFELSRNGSSALYCAINGTSQTSTGSMLVNTWSNSICTWDGTNLKGYINGSQQVASTAASNGTNRTEDLRVGTRATSDTANQRFQGYLDECFIINGTAISQQQACRIAKCGFDGEYCLCSNSPTTAFRPCTGDSDCRVAGSITCSGSKCAGRPYSSCSIDSDCNPYTNIALCVGGYCTGRQVGTCSGGADNGNNCSVDADCSGAGVCVQCDPGSCSDTGP